MSSKQIIPETRRTDGYLYRSPGLNRKARRHMKKIMKSEKITPSRNVPYLKP